MESVYRVSTKFSDRITCTEFGTAQSVPFHAHMHGVLVGTAAEASVLQIDHLLNGVKESGVLCRFVGVLADVAPTRTLDVHSLNFLSMNHWVAAASLG